MTKTLILPKKSKSKSSTSTDGQLDSANAYLNQGTSSRSSDKKHYDDRPSSSAGGGGASAKTKSSRAADTGKGTGKSSSGRGSKGKGKSTSKGSKKGGKSSRRSKEDWDLDDEDAVAAKKPKNYDPDYDRSLIPKRPPPGLAGPTETATTTNRDSESAGGSTRVPNTNASARSNSKTVKSTSAAESDDEDEDDEDLVPAKPKGPISGQTISRRTLPLSRLRELESWRRKSRLREATMKKAAGENTAAFYSKASSGYRYHYQNLLLQESEMGFFIGKGGKNKLKLQKAAAGTEGQVMIEVDERRNMVEIMSENSEFQARKTLKYCRYIQRQANLDLGKKKKGY